MATRSTSNTTRSQSLATSAMTSSGVHKSLATSVPVSSREGEQKWVSATCIYQVFSYLIICHILPLLGCKYVAHKQCLDMLTITCQEQQGLQHSIPIYLLAHDKHEQRKWIRTIELHRKRCESQTSNGIYPSQQPSQPSQPSQQQQQLQLQLQLHPSDAPTDSHGSPTSSS